MGFEQRRAQLAGAMQTGSVAGAAGAMPAIGAVQREGPGDVRGASWSCALSSE